MFKIEVNVNGTTHGHYWMNKHEDDFLQFLPNQFTLQYGELITKDEITAYKINEDQFALFEGKLQQHLKNDLDCDEGGAGVLRVCRKDLPRLNAGFCPRDIFDSQKSEREADFANAVTPQTVTDLATVQHDFGEGLVDAVEVPEGHELTLMYCSIELELTGTALSGWPYDENGNFLGNN